MDPTVFFDMSYGVYVVSAYDEEKGRSTGCTANSVMQVTAEPATVAVSVNHVNHTHACIEKTGKFAVSILAESSKPLIIGTFGFRSGRDFDKFAGFDTREVDGLQVLNDACGYFVCEVVQKMETETHTVFLGKVVNILPIGAQVELKPGKKGLVHISRLANHRVEKVEDEVQIGDEILVRVIAIKPDGKIDLTRKELLPDAKK